MPKRIQRRRTKGWRMPEGAVYVGRPSKWGNPFVVRRSGEVWRVIDINDRSAGLRERPQAMAYASDARVFAARFYELHTGPMGLYEFDDDTLEEIRRELGGRDLACWCPLDQACHADVLLELANGGAS